MSYEACEKHDIDVTNEACIECRAEEQPTKSRFPLGTATFYCSRYCGCDTCGRPTFEVRGGIDLVLDNDKHLSVTLCRGCLERLLHLATHNE